MQYISQKYARCFDLLNVLWFWHQFWGNSCDRFVHFRHGSFLASRQSCDWHRHLEISLDDASKFDYWLAAKKHVADMLTFNGGPSYRTCQTFTLPITQRFSESMSPLVLMQRWVLGIGVIKPPSLIPFEVSLDDASKFDYWLSAKKHVADTLMFNGSYRCFSRRTVRS